VDGVHLCCDLSTRYRYRSQTKSAGTGQEIHTRLHYPNKVFCNAEIVVNERRERRHKYNFATGAASLTIIPFRTREYRMVASLGRTYTTVKAINTLAYHWQ
jgi:hypothetical protein